MGLPYPAYYIMTFSMKIHVTIQDMLPFKIIEIWSVDQPTCPAISGAEPWIGSNSPGPWKGNIQHCHMKRISFI